MIRWYFDFISPFAYLQHAYLKQQHPEIQIDAVPILFAGLLKHWETKGPVEIPAKRIMTYQHCIWLAQKHRIEFITPPNHPFNPLNCLRLATAANNAPEVIDIIFKVIWAEGQDINAPQTWVSIAQQTSILNIEETISQPEIKARVRNNTEKAIADGVFGVPTLSVQGKLFWGFDMTDMAVEYAYAPSQFKTGEYLRVVNLPLAQSRNK